MLLSVAMMLRHSLGETVAAAALEGAITACWNDGVLTRDLVSDGRGTAAITEAVCDRLVASGTA